MIFWLSYAACFACVSLIAWDDIDLRDIAMLPVAIWTFIVERDSIDKEELGKSIGIILAFIFAPITVFAILCVELGQKYYRHWNEKVNSIFHNWEKLACDKAKCSVYELSDMKKSDEYYNLMREVARDMPYDSIKTFTNVDREEHKSWEPLIHAAIDELVERSILRGGK